MCGTVGFRHDPLHAADFSIQFFPCNEEAQMAAPRQTYAYAAHDAPPFAGKADARVSSAGISCRAGRSSARAAMGRHPSSPAHRDGIVHAPARGLVSSRWTATDLE